MLIYFQISICSNISFDELLAIEDKQNNLQELNLFDDTQMPTTSSRILETEKTQNLTNPFYNESELNYQTITIDDIFECFENQNSFKQNPAVNLPLDKSRTIDKIPIKNNKGDHHTVVCSLMNKLLTLMCKFLGRILAGDTNISNTFAQNTDLIAFLNSFENETSSTFENNINELMIKLQEFLSMITEDNVNDFQSAFNLNDTNEEYSVPKNNKTLNEQIIYNDNAFISANVHNDTVNTLVNMKSQDQKKNEFDANPIFDTKETILLDQQNEKNNETSNKKIENVYNNSDDLTNKYSYNFADTILEDKIEHADFMVLEKTDTIQDIDTSETESAISEFSMDTHEQNNNTNIDDEQKNFKPTVNIPEPTFLENQNVQTQILSEVEKEIVFILHKLISEQSEGINTSSKDHNYSKQGKSNIPISYGSSNENQCGFGNFIKTIVKALNIITNTEEEPENTLQNQAFELNNQIFGPNNQIMGPNSQIIGPNNQDFERNNEKNITIDLTTDSCEKSVYPSMDMSNTTSKFPNLVLLLGERVGSNNEKHLEKEKINSNKIHKRKKNRRKNWSNKKRKQKTFLKVPQTQIMFVPKTEIHKKIVQYANVKSDETPNVPGQHEHENSNNPYNSTTISKCFDKNSNKYESETYDMFMDDISEIIQQDNSFKVDVKDVDSLYNRALTETKKRKVNLNNK